MLIRIIAQYLESHRRLVIPQMGAFIVKEPGSSVLFSELLKRDDGVLQSLLTAAGIGEAAAAAEIERFVAEVRRAVQQGREFPLEGLGVLKAGPNATISFVYAPQTGKEVPASRTPVTGVPVRPEETPTASEPAGGPRPSAAGRASVPEPEAQPRKTGTAVRDLYGVESDAAAEPQAAQASRTAQPARPVQPEPEMPRQSTPSRFQLASKKLKRDELFSDSYYGRLPRRPAIEQTVNVKRRSDHFIWIALIAAVIALGAILFGQWCDSFNREGEEIYLEQPADMLPDDMPRY